MPVVLGALLITILRIGDVTLGTFRTILVVQGKKYYAAVIGFMEVLIWIYAMRFILDRLDSTVNLIAYAGGFALGNLIGIWLEEKVAIGFVQLNVISKSASQEIIKQLRESKYGATVLPAEGVDGGVNVVVLIIKRREMKKVMKLIEVIDPDSFITVQHSRPYRGFIHGSRK